MEYTTSESVLRKQLRSVWFQDLEEIGDVYEIPRPETVKSKSTGPPRWGSLSTRWPSSGPAVLLESLNSRHS